MMQYRVEAYKCRVNSVLELEDDMIPVGTVQVRADLFVICLDPLEERKLAEEKSEEEKEPGKEEEEQTGKGNGD